VRTRRWDFISDHRGDFGAKRLCRVLGVSGSGYYWHLASEEVRVERRVEEAGWSQRFAPSTPSTTAAMEPRGCMPNSEHVDGRSTAGV
jgi:hypothetical protein